MAPSCFTCLAVPHSHREVSLDIHLLHERGLQVGRRVDCTRVATNLASRDEARNFCGERERARDTDVYQPTHGLNPIIAEKF